MHKERKTEKLTLAETDWQIIQLVFKSALFSICQDTQEDVASVKQSEERKKKKKNNQRCHQEEAVKKEPVEMNYGFSKIKYSLGRSEDEIKKVSQTTL